MLSASPEFVLREFFAAWVEGDVERALAYCASDLVYRMHIDQAIVPFAGESQGVEALRERFNTLRAMLELISFEPQDYVTVGQRVRCQVRFAYRHRTSGSVIDSVFRYVVTIARGAIAEVDEFHDAARITAFMRFVATGSNSAADQG